MTDSIRYTILYFCIGGIISIITHKYTEIGKTVSLKARLCFTFFFWFITIMAIIIAIFKLSKGDVK